MFTEHTVLIIIYYIGLNWRSIEKKMLIGVATVGDYHEQGFVGTPV